MRTAIPFALFATTLACTLFAMPAQARPRVFVASYGTDSGTCSFTAPCRNLPYAYSVVDAGGEITMIDSAGYLGLTIGKSLTITSPPGVEASVTAPAGGAAITINAPGASDVVTLRGLTLNGGGSGGYGVNLTAGAKLAVIDCFITNYTQYGILVKNSAAATTLVLVSNTIVSETVGGIELATFGQGYILANFSGLTLDNNTDSIELIADGLGVSLNMANSQIGTNTQIGIYSKGNATNGQNIIALKNVNFGQMPQDIYLDGYTALQISQVTQLFNLTSGIVCLGSNLLVLSDQTNTIEGGFSANCNLNPYAHN